MFKAKSSQRALKLARRRLGMPQFPKEDVWRQAALVMGRPTPKSRLDGYALLREFTGAEAEQPTKKVKIVRPPVLKTAVPTVTRAAKKVSQRVLDAFLESYEWRKLRMVVLTKRGARCECCGATPKDGLRMNVDHIKPRRKFPELALEESNLQVLCEVCNHGKGNWDETDWREAEPLRLVK